MSCCVQSHVEKKYSRLQQAWCSCLVICRMEIKVLGCDCGWMAAGSNRERAFPPVVLTRCNPSVCGFVGTVTAQSIMRGIFKALFPHYLTSFLQKSLVQSHKHVPRYEESSVSLQQLDLLIVLVDWCLMKPWLTCLVHQLFNLHTATFLKSRLASCSVLPVLYLLAEVPPVWDMSQLLVFSRWWWASLRGDNGGWC